MQELSQGADRHKICLLQEESANSKQLQRLGSGVCIIEVEVEDVEGIESKVGTGFLGIFPDHLAGLLFLVTCRHVLPDEASCDNAICTFEASGQPGHSLTQAWRRGPPRSLSEDIMGAGASTEAAEAFNKASIADITAALAALSTEELAKIKEASAGAASASEQKEAGAEAAKPEEPAQDATKPAESATEEGSKPVEPAAAEAPPKEALEDAELKLKFQAAFRAIDTNKSGFIEVNELEAVLQTLGVNLTSEQAHTSVPFQESMIQPSYLSKSTVEL
ncbi:RMD1 [Symbiodinium sp. CCMP2592]|nr:RMD1 [Symbiodinium sp. CCMP2592]